MATAKGKATGQIHKKHGPVKVWGAYPRKVDAQWAKKLLRRDHPDLPTQVRKGTGKSKWKLMYAPDHTYRRVIRSLAKKS